MQERESGKSSTVQHAQIDEENSSLAQKVAREEGLSVEESNYLMTVFHDLLAQESEGPLGHEELQDEELRAVGGRQDARHASSERSRTTVKVSSLLLPASSLPWFAQHCTSFATDPEFFSLEWIEVFLNEDPKDFAKIMNPEHKFPFHRRDVAQCFSSLRRKDACRIRVGAQTNLDFGQVVRIMVNAHVGARRQSIQGTRFPLDPDSSSKQLWDLLVMSLLLTTSFSVPYTLAFGDEFYEYLFGQDGWAQEYAPGPNDVTPWFVFDLFVDIVFCTDILLNFCTAYIDRGVYVHRFRRIAENYLRTWFVIDFFGSVPFDKIVSAISGDDPQMNSFLEGLRLVRILKAVRAVRLVQRVNQLASKDTTGSIKGGAAVFRAIFVIIFISHFLACVFYMLIDLSGDGERNWMGAMDTRLLDKTVTPPQIRYVVAFYWAVLTITTTGYGDVRPVTHEEREMTIVCSLLGIVFFSYSVAQITTLVSDYFGKTEIDLVTRLSRLQAYLDFRVVDQECKRKVMSWYSHSYRESGKLFDEHEIMADLPRPLRQGLLQVIGRENIETMPFMVGMSEACAGDLFLRLAHYSYDCEDVIFRMHDRGSLLYILEAGSVSVDRRSDICRARECDNMAVAAEHSAPAAGHASHVCQKGDFFGELCLYDDIATTRHETAVAISHVRTLTLSREDFHVLAERHPVFGGLMRDLCLCRAAVQGVLPPSTSRCVDATPLTDAPPSGLPPHAAPDAGERRRNMSAGMRCPCVSIPGYCAVHKQSESDGTCALQDGAEIDSLMDQMKSTLSSRREHLFSQHASAACEADNAGTPTQHATGSPEIFRCHLLTDAPTNFVPYLGSRVEPGSAHSSPSLNASSQIRPTLSFTRDGTGNVTPVALDAERDGGPWQAGSGSLLDDWRRHASAASSSAASASETAAVGEEGERGEKRATAGGQGSKPQPTLASPSSHDGAGSGRFWHPISCAVMSDGAVMYFERSTHGLVHVGPQAAPHLLGKLVPMGVEGKAPVGVALPVLSDCCEHRFGRGCRFRVLLSVRTYSSIDLRSCSLCLSLPLPLPSPLSLVDLTRRR